MFKRVGKLKGGYIFKNYTGQPTDVLLEAALPAQVIIPLKQGLGNEVKPLVKKGDTVTAGQIIGRDDTTISSPVHASVNGVVEDIRRMNYFKRDINMVTIKTGNKSLEIVRLSGAAKDWGKLKNEKIEELIYLSGVSSLDGEGIPTRFKSSFIPPEKVQHLIIHGVGSEPYNISLELLLADKNIQNFIEGIKILKRVMPKCKVHLALNARKKKIIESIKKLTTELEWLDIILLEPKYPQGYDEILVPTILREKFPYTYSAANMGVIILNIQAVLGVYDAVAAGLPLIERIVALSGPCFKENIHLKVRVGTSLGDIVKGRLKEGLPIRLIDRSILRGFHLQDTSLPAERTISNLIAIPENREREFLAFIGPGVRRDSYSRGFLAKWLPGIKKFPDTNLRGEERACISCNFCTDVCPVQIIPHLISKYVRAEIIDEIIMQYGIFNCIDCGLCNFVCPSKIKLLENIKKGREKLVEENCGPDRCILPHFELIGIEEYRGVTKL